jgi:phosphoesterase RecJ-like protein
LALDLNWKINTDIATCIYTAILTDTGNFRHIKTPDAFIDTAKCVEFGANPELISQIMGKKNKQDVLINAEIILNTQFFFNDKLAISVIDKQTYPRLDGKGSNTMAELLSIDTIEYIALIKEVKTDEIYVSLRSKTDPVNIIAKELGGGGHPNAGAFKSQTSIENTTKLLIAEFTAILS